ncbi:hypothetical protein [Bradyrhizobium centrolobii]|nr:hypothetical protein [Bradyrhizobium centrolobii]
MNYLTGYDAYSYYVPQFVIVSLKHRQPVWIGRFMDRVSAVMTSYLDDQNIHAYEDKYVHSAALSAFDVIAETVKDLGGERPCIGVELGGYYYSEGSCGPDAGVAAGEICRCGFARKLDSYRQKPSRTGADASSRVNRRRDDATSY